MSKSNATDDASSAASRYALGPRAAAPSYMVDTSPLKAARALCGLPRGCATDALAGRDAAGRLPLCGLLLLPLCGLRGRCAEWASLATVASEAASLAATVCGRSMGRSGRGWALLGRGWALLGRGWALLGRGVGAYEEGGCGACGCR